ncbi:proline-rich protein 36-like [Hippopotamus amphibius kiboko]|uniref:proline-rich protein 36-like n=1 Tax=Hippopotamus amphibius kiboko TaxID=575201 RepID=UPI0025950A35|nr:proline-rich protein 36-like [Hippopotamus amphibius kiboko]
MSLGWLPRLQGGRQVLCGPGWGPRSRRSPLAASPGLALSPSLASLSALLIPSMFPAPFFPPHSSRLASIHPLHSLDLPSLCPSPWPPRVCVWPWQDPSFPASVFAPLSPLPSSSPRSLHLFLSPFLLSHSRLPLSIPLQAHLSHIHCLSLSLSHPQTHTLTHSLTPSLSLLIFCHLPAILLSPPGSLLPFCLPNSPSLPLSSPDVSESLLVSSPPSQVCLRRGSRPSSAHLFSPPASLFSFPPSHISAPGFLSSPLSLLLLYLVFSPFSSASFLSSTCSLPPCPLPVCPFFLSSFKSTSSPPSLPLVSTPPPPPSLPSVSSSVFSSSYSSLCAPCLSHLSLSTPSVPFLSLLSFFLLPSL